MLITKRHWGARMIAAAVGGAGGGRLKWPWLAQASRAEGLGLISGFIFFWAQRHGGQATRRGCAAEPLALSSAEGWAGREATNGRRAGEGSGRWCC
ncbi:uncharacterized protein VTP21DRAFT_2025 [Calcarisporiella thermophila]|uniref:uncharacterized protein n=1 Tax=Calcarisporiella thermophila TaxID=911321 RepID=UPI00374242AE